MRALTVRNFCVWALKGALLLVATPLALLAVFKISVAGAFGDSLPDVALTWAPNDATAKANWAAQALTPDQEPETRRLAHRLAIEALLRDPTRVAAFRAMALGAEADGDQAQTLRLMNESDRLSRRDQLTQIWLVEHYIRTGDTTEVIRHFDTALRTSSESKPLLFSALISATEDPRIAAALAAKLREKPEWWLEFTAELASRGRQLPIVALMIRGLLAPDVPEERTVIESFLQRLTNGQQFDLAWQVYQSVARNQPSASPSVTVRNGGIEMMDGFAPFDWLVVQEPDLRAERMARPDSRPGNALFLTATDGRTGEVASQLMRLDAASYHFDVETGAVPADVLTRPDFRIMCVGGANDGHVLMDVRPGNASVQAVHVGGNFTVPEGCRWQWLRINIASGDSNADAAPWIDNVSVVRLPR